MINDFNAVLRGCIFTSKELTIYRIQYSYICIIFIRSWANNTQIVTSSLIRRGEQTVLILYECEYYLYRIEFVVVK